MEKFGILKKDLDQKLLTEAVLMGSLGAYLIKEREFMMTPFSRKKIEQLNKLVPKSTLDKLENLNDYEKSKARNTFFALSPKIYELPITALINSITNNPSLNTKLIDLGHEVKLNDIEIIMRKGTFKKRYAQFTTADCNTLRKSIILLNCIFSEEIRPQNNLCFSKTILDDIVLLNKSEDVLDYLVKKAKKGNKKKVKEVLIDLPEEISTKELISFFSSLSTDISKIWPVLTVRKKRYLYDNYALFKSMNFESFTWSKRKLMPSFAITSFESSKGRNISYILPFFRKRFLRVQNLSFLDPEFRVMTDGKNSLLENLEILKDNFS